MTKEDIIHASDHKKATFVMSLFKRYNNAKGAEKESLKSELEETILYFHDNSFFISVEHSGMPSRFIYRNAIFDVENAPIRKPQTATRKSGGHRNMVGKSGPKPKGDAKRVLVSVYLTPENKTRTEGGGRSDLINLLLDKYLKK